jgi:hypothetical protein
VVPLRHQQFSYLTVTKNQTLRSHKAANFMMHCTMLNAHNMVLVNPKAKG